MQADWESSHCHDYMVVICTKVLMSCELTALFYHTLKIIDIYVEIYSKQLCMIVQYK